MIRDGIKSIAMDGVPPEMIWPYNIEKFAVKPPPKSYAAAALNQALSYQRITQAIAQLKGCLASGYPFVFGFTVYESFESPDVAKTGTIPMPIPKKERAVGGHAVLAVGYDDAVQRFIVRNSWGEEWGDKGHCTFPYEYLLNTRLSSDFWTVRLVE
jgi:C1A family cysteine protease